jgi:hypothetical protein
MNIGQFRDIYKDKGPVGFKVLVDQMLGLRNLQGHRNRDEDGHPVLESASMRPEQFSILGLGKAIFGSEEATMRKFSSGPAAPPIPEMSADVMEAGNDIVPSMFQDISAWNETIASLIEVKIIEGWERPEFVLSKLAKNVPSNKLQEKAIGISTPGDTAQSRQPGQTHPRATVSQRYVISTITQNVSNAIDVTREAVQFDLTRELLDSAELVGHTLALRKEYNLTDAFIGVPSYCPYNYGGVTYSTFVSSGGNWVNLIQNPVGASGYSALDNDYLLFSQMTDQETGQPVAIDARQLVTVPALNATLSHLVRQTQVAIGSAPGATSGTLVRGYGESPLKLAGQQWEAPIVSPYIYRRATDPDGLALTPTNAAGLWFACNVEKYLWYVENSPLVVEKAAPTSYAMLDRGLVYSVFADQRGIPMVKEPRFCIKNQVQAV